jgi:hypothetical protein
MDIRKTGKQSPFKQRHEELKSLSGADFLYALLEVRVTILYPGQEVSRELKLGHCAVLDNSSLQKQHEDCAPDLKNATRHSNG